MNRAPGTDIAWSCQKYSQVSWGLQFVVCKRYYFGYLFLPRG